MKFKYCRANFTLIELLVVISIIAVLASMLLPALLQARAKTNVIVCANKLKTLGHYMFLYTADNDGVVLYINKTTWGAQPGRVAAFTQYVGYTISKSAESSVYKCPSRDKTAEYQNISYGFNYYMGSFGKPTHHTTHGDGYLTKHKHPAETMMFMEHFYDSKFTRGVPWYAESPAGWTSKYRGYLYAAQWHNGKMNVVYTDGHVDRYVPDRNEESTGVFFDCLDK